MEEVEVAEFDDSFLGNDHILYLCLTLAKWPTYSEISVENMVIPETLQCSDHLENALVDDGRGPRSMKTILKCLQLIVGP